MRIPKRNLEKFVREIADQCMVSVADRALQYETFKNYYLCGGDTTDNAAIYNKTFSYIDELESLLYSPVSLKFQLSNPLTPNILEDEKGRVAAGHLRSLSREGDIDNTISQAVLWSLVKGKTMLKMGWKRDQLRADLTQPEYFGVLRENYGKLDEDMEAFTHRMFITPYQFLRIIAGRPDEELLKRRMKRHISAEGQPGAARMPVITGGIAPFQAANGQGQTSSNRGMVEWMSSPTASLSPKLAGQILVMDEVWVWDDDRNDWATFQIIGDDILLLGKYTIINAMAWNKDTGQSCEALRGSHPYIEFSPNEIDEYFWGRSEIVNVCLLQEAINSRINGTNRILRLQENPPKKFIGSTGVNQQAIARFNKAGGYWSDANPNAKIENDAPQMPPDLWGSLHEYERMFDEMGGLPPIARGRGDAGVRSQGHAETLVRMFSPRFKDRALLIERSVAATGTLSLDLCKVHNDDTMLAWVPADAARVEKGPDNPMVQPPFKDAVSVPFKFGNLDSAMKLSVDSHSSSPAFSQEAKSLIFDLLKIGAASPADVIERTDPSDPDGLLAGLRRREVSQAESAAQEAKLEEQKIASHHR